MLIVRTWVPNSFIRMLVCCLIWLQILHCLGTQGEIRDSCFSTVTFEWTPAPNSGWKCMFWTRFLQRHQGKHNTGFVTATSLHLSLLSQASEMLFFCSSWAHRNFRHSVFFKKAQPWLSVLDVYGKAGANWKHTTEGRERLMLLITCQEWSASEMEGEGSKGRL